MPARKKSASKKKAVKKAAKKTAPISATKASKRAKKATAKIMTPKKVTPKKVAPKKIAPKKLAPKKVTPKKVAPKESPNVAQKKTLPGNRIATQPEAPVERGFQVASSVLNLNITFYDGVGQASAKHSRGGTPLTSINVGGSSNVVFNDVRSNDIISITGDCAGRAEIFTNRTTSPATAQGSPLICLRVIDEILIIQ